MPRLNPLMMKLAHGAIISLLAVLAFQIRVWASPVASWNITVSLPGGGTATFTPTPTASPTPGPASTPVVEHFNATSTGQAAGWYNVDNCAMNTSGTGSAKATLGAVHLPGNYGWLTSNTVTMDISANNTLHLRITAADAGVGLKVYLHEAGQPSGILMVQNPAVGPVDIDIPAQTGWSGSKSFYIEMLLESGLSSVGVRFDEIWICPSGSTGFAEDFPLAGSPPPNWFIEYNTVFTGNGTDSAYLVKGATDNWGSATSGTMTVNVDTHGTLSVFVNNVDASTGNQLYVHESGQSDLLVDSGLGAGVHNYNLRAAPVNWSGSKTFYIRLVVQTNTAGTGTRFDGFSVGSFNQ
jgi:hypothetical protein